MTVKEFVEKHVFPEDTIPTQSLTFNHTPVTIHQCMTQKTDDYWINNFTGEIHNDGPHDFVIIQAYNDCHDGPIIGIIYDDANLNWFNNWLFWNEPIGRRNRRLIKIVLEMNRKIHEYNTINEL